MSSGHSQINLAMVMPSSHGSSVQKIMTIAALDLARNGHQVTIFVPLLSWYYYFVSLRRQPLLWLRYIVPNLRNLTRQRKTHFNELLSEEESANRVTVRFVLMRASRKQLSKFDYLLINSIDNVVGYEDRFEGQRQLYMVHHPEEHIHGYAEVFKRLRQDFKGKILTISSFTARELGDHVGSVPVVPNPVTPALWSPRKDFDATRPRRDILLFWKENQSGTEGAAVVEEVLRARSETSVTIWCSGVGARSGAQEALPGAQLVENLSETELGHLFLDHSFLVFPSNYEGFGMPPIEAMAGGCVPILHPLVGAAEMYAREGKNSLDLGAGPTVVAQQVLELLDDAGAMEAIRKEAANSVAPFDPNGYGIRLLEAAAVI